MKKKLKNKLVDITSLSKSLRLINKKTGKPSTHTLRFWETKFTSIKPIRLSGRKRLYNENQVKKIKLIKFLIKDQGISISGVKKIINKKINSLDGNLHSSIKAEYYKNLFKKKTDNLLEKIKKLKSYGKKNTH